MRVTESGKARFASRRALAPMRTSASSCTERATSSRKEWIETRAATPSVIDAM